MKFDWRKLTAAAAVAVEALGKEAEGLPIGNGRDVAASSVPSVGSNVTGLGTGVINGNYNTVYPGEILYVNSDNIKAAREPFADITNTQDRPQWLHPPLTPEELKLAQENREARIRKQEERNQAREETQRKMNQFGDALQQALLPCEDDAARHGNSAPPLGKANMGSGHDL